ncbi:MAG: uracil-DNA glycosylase family protein [Armatimonadota bacterium]
MSSSARVLIAGQAPGRKVHESGIPFDDASGERLRDWLGLSREEFYDASKVAILPMGFCYPGTGKSGDLPPRPECAEAWRQRLTDQMRELRLTIVIGQYAQAYHMSDERRSLTEAVKDDSSQYESLILIPHPSPRNNIWLAKNPWFVSDVLPTIKERVRAALIESSS